MSVDSEVEDLAGPLDEELIDALVDDYRLSQEQVALIKELMALRGLKVVEAALDLNLITADQAAKILDGSRSNIAQTSVVETALRRQSVGRVATVPPTVYVKPSKELLLAHTQDHPHCERLRALRTELSLLLSTGGRQASVVAILSPGPSEGRSQLAAELAIAFAQQGRRTLLVEADLRRPRQHLLFGAGHAPGIAQCLTIGKQPQFLRVESLPQLSLLTSGPVPPNPLELLSDGRFERLLSDWRRIFEILIIDTPAVTQFADGLAIASFAEQVLLLSRANITRHKDMNDTLRRLVSTNARILGAVINKF
jgi:protein-tyrosine kinase